MRILICSIGTRQCEVTLRFGALVAQGFSADVTLLGIAEKGCQDTQLRQALDEVSRQWADLDLPVQVQIYARADHAEDLVLAETEQTAYDLIVLGALGSKRAHHTLRDLVGMRIVEEAESSVLVVKGDRPTLSRVLVCSSGTVFSRPAVQMGAAVACAAGAEVTLLHVMQAMPIMYTGLEEMEETLAELLQTDTELARELKWASQVAMAQCQVVHLKLRQGIVSDEILQEAQAGDHDLIVVGSSRSTKGLVRVLLGDLSRDLIGRARRPVLVVSSQFEAAAGQNQPSVVDHLPRRSRVQR